MAIKRRLFIFAVSHVTIFSYSLLSSFPRTESGVVASRLYRLLVSDDICNAWKIYGSHDFLIWLLISIDSPITR